MNWRRFAVIVFLLAAAACHRKVSVVTPPVVAPPAPPVPAAVLPVVPATLRDGESAYDSGDFGRAARSLETYLESNPQADDLDRTLFQFGVAQAMSGAAAREASSSDGFNRLIRDFPQSPYVPPARMILSLRADIARLQAEAAELQSGQKSRDDRINALDEQVGSQQSNITQLQSDNARLLADQKTRDDKIKQLNDQLDNLKKIDLGRRTP